MEEEVERGEELPRVILETGEEDVRDSLLADILEPWTGYYRHILIDCPPSLGHLTQMAFTASERVLIPVQCDYFSSWGLLRLLDVTGTMNRGTESRLDCHLLATMYDPRNAVCRNVYERLKLNFPHLLMHTVIGIDTMLRECELVGESILTYAPACRASDQYRKLAKEWVSRTQGPED